MLIYITVDGTWHTEQGQIEARGTYPIECSEAEAQVISKLDLNDVLSMHILNGKFDQDAWIHPDAPEPFTEYECLNVFLTEPEDAGTVMEVNYYTMFYALQDVELIGDQE